MCPNKKKAMPYSPFLDSRCPAEEGDIIVAVVSSSVKMSTLNSLVHKSLIEMITVRINVVSRLEAVV